MNVVSMLRSKLSKATCKRRPVPKHYRGNQVSEDIKEADPVWLTDVDPMDLLVFVHIPKAAGTSLNSILWQVYGRRYVNYHQDLSSRSTQKTIEKHADQIMAIGAHMPYGFHLSFTVQTLSSKGKKIFEGRNCRYVTVLRNPVERMKSYYRFVTTFPAHRLHRETKEMSPDSFFRHMRVINNPECHNLQCELAGLSKSFEAARDHLSHHYHVVGVVEQMDDFVGQLQITLNWPDVFDKSHRNASPRHLHDENFGQDTIDWITESNQEDMKLYRYAKQHLAPGAGSGMPKLGTGEAGSV